jgi:hypothetical protein
MRAPLCFIPVFAASACSDVVTVEATRVPPIEHTPDPAPADACTAGPPTTIATIRSPAGLALGDGMLFFTDGGDLYDCTGAVYAVPLEGGEPEVLASGLCAPNRIVHADGALYWLSHSGYVAPNGDLTRLDLADGTMEVLMAGLISPDALAVDDGHVYVGESVDSELQSPGRVVRFHPATHERVDLGVSPGMVADIAVDEEHVYWTGSVGFLNGHENHDSGVFRVSKSGGEALELAGGLAWPHGLARVGTRVVVAHNHDGQILSLAADGADRAQIAEGLEGPQDVAVDGDVFFTGWGPPGGVFAIPLDGSAAPRLIAGSVGAGDQIALGANCVYWTEHYVDDESNGAVRKAAR